MEEVVHAAKLTPTSINQRVRESKREGAVTPPGRLGCLRGLALCPLQPPGCKLDLGFYGTRRYTRQFTHAGEFT